MDNKIINFFSYRFHLLPISDKPKQLYIFPKKTYTLETIKKKKNVFFAKILDALVDNKKNTHPLKLEHSDGGFYLFKIAQKKKTIISKDFKNLNIPNEPFCYIIINNDSSVQKIAISSNIDAFSSPDTVKNILIKIFRLELEQYGLNIEIEQMFDSASFWEYTKKYRDRLTAINFKFIKPNLANISKSLPEDFRKFTENVNSHESHIIIKAPEKGVLDNISQNNISIKGLVDYSANGAGNIKLKVKNIRKQLSTKEKPSITTIKELDIEGTADQVIKLYKTIVE